MSHTDLSLGFVEMLTPQVFFPTLQFSNRFYCSTGNSKTPLNTNKAAFKKLQFNFLKTLCTSTYKDGATKAQPRKIVRWRVASQIDRHLIPRLLLTSPDHTTKYHLTTFSFFEPPCDTYAKTPITSIGCRKHHFQQRHTTDHSNN